MNAYLSKEEKHHFIRLSALALLIEPIIDEYSQAKSTDKDFLKYLRMGSTLINKALEMRGAALEKDAKADFVKQVRRLEFICVPTLEAKKAHAELLTLRSTIPMEIEDFQDWYSAVIETTCKRCYTDNFAECPIRKVLSKYGVYPIDPEAKGKCQYSYVGTPEAEELQPVEGPMAVPADVYNAALAAVKGKENAINELYVPLIKQLQDEINNAKTQLVDILYLEDDRPENPSLDELISCVKESFQNCDAQDHDQMEEIRSLRAQVAETEGKLLAAKDEIERLDTLVEDISEVEQERDKFRHQVTELESQLQAAVAAQEQPKEEYPVTIYLAGGGEFEYLLPARMAEVMIKEIQQPRHSRSTCAQYAGGYLVAIDLQEVVALHVDKLPPGDWVKQKAVQDVPGQQEKYRVECKCGAEYFIELAAGKTKAWCRECRTAVFADRKAEVQTADGASATLLTNRYWVEREQLSELKKEVASVSSMAKSCGKDYVDPIGLRDI